MTLSKQMRKDFYWNVRWAIKIHNSHSTPDQITQVDIEKWINEATGYCYERLLDAASYYSLRERQAADRTIDKCRQEVKEAYEDFMLKLRLGLVEIKKGE